MKLDSTFVVLQPDQSATPVAATPTIWQELDQRFDNFKGRVLVSCFSFDADWETWEMHPAGDEIVCLLSGRASFEFEGRGHVGELMKPHHALRHPRRGHPEQGDRLMALELRPLGTCALCG